MINSGVSIRATRQVAGLDRLPGIGDTLSRGCMISLSDHHLQTIMTAANAVPVERRSVFLERVGAMLKVRGRFSDDDVADVARAGAVRVDSHHRECGMMLGLWVEMPGLRRLQIGWSAGRPGPGPVRYTTAILPLNA